MNRYCSGFALLLLCSTVDCVLAQERTTSISGLAHIGPNTSLQCKRVNIDIAEVDVWYARRAQGPVFSSDATKYASDIDAATTPGSGDYIAVKSLIGDTDVILNPRSDTDYTKATVKLSGVRNGRPYLQYIWPCDWSSDGGKLLIAGRSGDEGYSASIWAIDLKTMKGSPVSRLLKDESTDRASFSPDGKMVAYVVTPIKYEKDAGGALDVLNDRLLIASADGGNTKRLAQGADAAWSPDSQHLLISTASQLWITDATGKRKRILFPVMQPEHKPYPRYVSGYYHVTGHPQYYGVGFGRMGWLDEHHFIVTVLVRTQGYRSFHDVWILDSDGKVLQVIRSASLDHVWPQKKTLIIVEEHADRKGDAWFIKY